MQGEVDTGVTLCGYTGVGPGSVLAVYNCDYEGRSATCTIFREGEREGRPHQAISSQLALGAITDAMPAGIVKPRTM